MQKEFLIFWPIKNNTNNLGDQLLILWCIKKIWKGQTSIIIHRTANTDFLKDTKNIRLLYHPDIKNWVYLYIKDLGEIISYIIQKIPRKIEASYYIGADVLDGRWWKISKLFMCMILISKIYSNKLWIISFSYWKTKWLRNKIMLKIIKNYCFFYPRDSTSLVNIKKDINAKKVELINDLSFLVENTINKNVKKILWLQKNQKILAISIAKRKNIKNMDIFLEKLANQINEMGDEWTIVIIQHIFEEETRLYTENLFEKIRQKKVLVQERNALFVRQLIKYSDYCFSCLMHFGLGAIKYKKRVTILDYDDKCTNILVDLNLSSVVTKDENTFIQRIKEIK